MCIILLTRYVTLLSMFFVIFFFFKQKTAYEMRISDWSSDVCSSDLDLLRGDARWAWSEQRGRNAVCGPADRAAQADPGADADPAEVAGERGPCRRHGRYGGRHPADRWLHRLRRPSLPVLPDVLAGPGSGPGRPAARSRKLGTAP